MPDKPDLFDIVEEEWRKAEHEWQRKEREQEGATQLPPCCDFRNHSGGGVCYCNDHPRSNRHPYGTL